MGFNYDFSADFLTLDNLEPVTLRIPGQADQAIATAIQNSATKKDPDQSGGQVVEGDRFWAWPIAQTPTRPPLGSMLIDQYGENWTILDTTRKQTPWGVWTAHVRNLAIAFNLNNKATLLQATYTKSPAGEAIATYAQIAINGSPIPIPARFQPESQDAQILEDAEWPKTSYSVFLGVDIFDPVIPVEPASADFRLEDSAGRHYRIMSYTRAERIDALPIAKCVLIIEGQDGGAIDRISSNSSGS